MSLNLGFDLVGRVVELGEGVPSSWSGVRVFGFYDRVRALRGTTAELATISIHDCCVIPPEIDRLAAVATPLAGSTALQALRDDARLKVGKRVLIVGASGGVGTLNVLFPQCGLRYAHGLRRSGGLDATRARLSRRVDVGVISTGHEL